MLNRWFAAASVASVLCTASLAAAAPTPPQQLARCNELRSQRKWSAVLDCARQLDASGDHDNASKLHDVAQRETANASLDTAIRAELTNDLPELAQMLFRQVDRDSVYFSALHDKIDDPAIEKCDPSSAEDIELQAGNQYNSGYAHAALYMITKALLSCDGNERRYRLAATFACGAQDAAMARLYYAHVPPNLQAAIQQVCLRNHIDLTR